MNVRDHSARSLVVVLRLVNELDRPVPRLVVRLHELNETDRETRDSVAYIHLMEVRQPAAPSPWFGGQAPPGA